MTTEYYQIPSQQGFLPLESAADPWLAAATSTLTISDWSAGKTKQVNPPSLFEPEDAEASVSWNQVVPLQYKPAVAEVKAPVAPKKFNSTSSKINAWSVVDDNNTISSPSPKQRKQQTKQPVPASPKPQTKATKPSVKSPPVVEEKPVEDELGQQNRYKTELCKSFTETGACRYGNKCQFAHGKEEIKPILRHPKYKTEICKTFHTTGTCPYGIRCRFIHTRSKEEVVIPKPQEEEIEEDADDDAVPQWSKSWTMSLASAVPSKNRNAVVAPEPAF